MQNPEKVCSRLWVRKGFWKDALAKWWILAWPPYPTSDCLELAVARHAILSQDCPWCVWLYAAMMCTLKKRKYNDTLQRLVSEHVLKLPSQYDTILTSVIKLVLYKRYTNTSWPVKISGVSRENQSMRLTLEKIVIYYTMVGASSCFKQDSLPRSKTLWLFRVQYGCSSTFRINLRCFASSMVLKLYLWP